MVLLLLFNKMIWILFPSYHIEYHTVNMYTFSLYDMATFTIHFKHGDEQNYLIYIFSLIFLITEWTINMLKTSFTFAWLYWKSKARAAVSTFVVKHFRAETIGLIEHDGRTRSKPTVDDMMLEDLRMIHLSGPIPNIHLQNDC